MKITGPINISPIVQHESQIYLYKINCDALLESSINKSQCIDSLSLKIVNSRKDNSGEAMETRCPKIGNNEQDITPNKEKRIQMGKLSRNY